MMAEVTQADRLLFIELFCIPAQRQGLVLDGSEDTRTELQAIARHRVGAVKPLTDALNWYAEKVADCGKISAQGDDARYKLDRDGGSIARAALQSL